MKQKENEHNHSSLWICIVGILVLIVVLVFLPNSENSEYNNCPSGYKQEWKCLEETNYAGACHNFKACIIGDVVILGEVQCDTNKYVTVEQCSEPEQDCLRGQYECVRDD